MVGAVPGNITSLPRGGRSPQPGTKREMTTSRRDSRPAGGVWQGINTRTGAVASAIWVNRLLWPQAMVFITVAGESLRGDASSPEADAHHEDGGEA